MYIVPKSKRSLGHVLGMLRELGKGEVMAEPKEIAASILSMKEPKRAEHLTKILEMVQAAIVIRSACRDKMFVTLSGREDAGTKFDRLLKELFGMAWVDKPEKKRSRSRSHRKASHELSGASFVD